MNKDTATKVFESLASGIRLDVWRLLVKAGLEGMVASQLASELDIAPEHSFIPSESHAACRPCLGGARGPFLALPRQYSP